MLAHFVVYCRLHVPSQSGPLPPYPPGNPAFLNTLPTVLGTCCIHFCMFLSEASPNHFKTTSQLQNHFKTIQNHFKTTSKPLQNHFTTSKPVQNHSKPLQNHFKTIQNHFKTTSKPLQNHFKTTSKPLHDSKKHIHFEKKYVENIWLGWIRFCIVLCGASWVAISKWHEQVRCTTGLGVGLPLFAVGMCY